MNTLSRRPKLQLLLIILLAFAALALPGIAFAEDDDSSETVTQSIEETAESWRYSGGQTVENPDTDGELSLLASTSVYSTWKKAYGTSYLGITTATTSNGTTTTSTTKVAVDGGVRVVIDVSKWNGSIDWEKVAASGVTAAIIRCGYGSDYESQDDAYFLANVEGALENGIEIGIYLYSYATKVTGSDGSAASEAAHVLRLLEEAGLEPDDLDLPIFYDLEDSNTTGTCTTARIGAMAEEFCDTIAAEGYTVGIYASMSWWNNYLTDDAFDNDTWFKWVARYPTKAAYASAGIDDADLWQFTSHGTVSGISGNVDVSFDYLGSGSYVDRPSTPTLKSVTVASDLASITVKWSKVSSADGYEVYRSVDGGSYELVKTITSASTVSWKDTDVELGSTYTYQVRAYVTSSSTTITGDFSDELSASVLPAQVTGLAATASSGYESVGLSWTAVSAAEGYEVWRAVGDGDYALVATVSSASWTDEDVEANASYSYQVRAFVTASDGTSAYGSYSAAVSITMEPDAPVMGTVGKWNALTKATVKWTAVEGVDGYEVWRSDAGGDYALVATVDDGDAVSYVDDTLTLGASYTYKVRAYAGSVYGDFGDAASVSMVPNTISVKSAAATTAGAVKITWSKSTAATGYVIYRSVNGGSYSKVKTVTGSTTTSWTDTTVTPGRLYRYKVKAYKSVGSTTVYSATFGTIWKARAKPAQPTISSATSTAKRCATIKWAKVSGATGYQVAYCKKGTSKWYYVTTTSTSQKFTKFLSKNYYIKVRAYTTYNGTKYYGSWSTQKSLTVKQ